MENKTVKLLRISDKAQGTITRRQRSSALSRLHECVYPRRNEELNSLSFLMSLITY